MSSRALLDPEFQTLPNNLRRWHSDSPRRLKLGLKIGIHVGLLTAESNCFFVPPRATAGLRSIYYLVSGSDHCLGGNPNQGAQLPISENFRCTLSFYRVTKTKTNESYVRSECYLRRK